jgi:DNA-binding response OmpR family regulator
MKILVIDDDPAMTDLLKLLLMPASTNVVAANISTEGVSLARSEAPDLILLDLMMPDMDGIQVCKAVRTFSSTPIIILSAINTPGMVAAALDNGADDYLIKPISSGMLLARINKLMRRVQEPVFSPAAA